MDKSLDKERAAIRTDAQQRVHELRNVARSLWSSRDDATVLSELVSVMSELRAAEAVLAEEMA